MKTRDWETVNPLGEFHVHPFYPSRPLIQATRRPVVHCYGTQHKRMRKSEGLRKDLIHGRV